MNEAQLQHKAEQEEKYSNLVESVVTSPVDVIVEQMKYIHDRHSLEYVSEAAFQKLYQLFLTLQFEDKLKLLHFVADIVDEQEQDKLFKAVQDGSDYDKINFLVRFRIGDVMSSQPNVLDKVKTLMDTMSQKARVYMLTYIVDAVSIYTFLVSENDPLDSQVVKALFNHYKTEAEEALLNGDETINFNDLTPEDLA